MSDGTTTTASNFPVKAVRPKLSDAPWVESSSSSFLAIVIGNPAISASTRSLWWPVTTTSSSTPAPESAISCRLISGTPAISIRLLGMDPIRRPSPAAITTAPTTSRLYRPPPPLRIQPTRQPRPSRPVLAPYRPVF